MIEIKVMLFAHIRDLIGKEELNLRTEDGITVSDTLSIIKKSFPVLEKLPVDSFMVAVNMEYVSRNHVLKDGDIIAIIPPVGGGR